MSSSSGRSPRWKDSGVPQRLQKLRVPLDACEPAPGRRPKRSLNSQTNAGRGGLACKEQQNGFVLRQTIGTEDITRVY